MSWTEKLKVVKTIFPSRKSRHSFPPLVSPRFFLRELFSGTLSSERLEQAVNLPVRVARALFVYKCKLSLV